MCKVRSEYQPYSHQVRGAGVLKQGQQQGVVVGERRLLARRVHICQQLHTLGGRNQHCQIEQQSLLYHYTLQCLFVSVVCF